MLAFTFALAVATGVLFGIVPALQTSRPDLHEELKGGAGSSVSPGRRRRFTSNALVAAEIALSLLLLVSAGLVAEGFRAAAQPGHRRAAGGRLDGGGPAARGFLQDRPAAIRVRAGAAGKSARIPGVDAAAISDRLPLEGGSNDYIKLRGQTSEGGQQAGGEPFRLPGLFPRHGSASAPGPAVYRGGRRTRLWRSTERWRQLTEGGGRLSPDQTNAMVYPTVINETMARFFWPNQNPLGQMFSYGSDTGPGGR